MSEPGSSAEAATFKTVSELMKKVQTSLSGALEKSDKLKAIGFELPESIGTCKEGLDSALTASEKMPDAMKDEDIDLEPGWKEDVEAGISTSKEIEGAIAATVNKLKMFVCMPCLIPAFVKPPEMPDLGPLSKVSELGEQLMAKAASPPGMGGFMDKVKDAVQEVAEDAGIPVAEEK